MVGAGIKKFVKKGVNKMAKKGTYYELLIDVKCALCGEDLWIKDEEIDRSRDRMYIYVLPCKCIFDEEKDEKGGE